MQAQWLTFLTDPACECSCSCAWESWASWTLLGRWKMSSRYRVALIASKLHIKTWSDPGKCTFSLTPQDLLLLGPYAKEEQFEKRTLYIPTFSTWPEKSSGLFIPKCLWAALWDRCRCPSTNGNVPAFWKLCMHLLGATTCCSLCLAGEAPGKNSSW